MNSKSGVEYARTFFTRENSNDYDKLVRVTTLGRDAIWKKKIVSYIPGNSYVLDLACGTGILSSMLIEKQNDVLGVDLGHSRCSARGSNNHGREDHLRSQSGARAVC